MVTCGSERVDMKSVELAHLVPNPLTSLVVIVFFSMSKHIGHISSLCRLRGEIEISVPSVMASCGVR